MGSDMNTRARGARTNKGIIDEGERLGFAVGNEGKRRLRFVHLELGETNGLVETIDAGGLQAGFLELLDGVGLGFAKTLAAGVATFERVVSQKFDVCPPGVAVEVGSGWSLLGGSGENEHKNHSEKTCFTHEIHLRTIWGYEDSTATRGTLQARDRDTIPSGCPFNLNGTPEKRRQMRKSTAFPSKRQLPYSRTLWLESLMIRSIPRASDERLLLAIPIAGTSS